jgi:hypothetical protein
MTEAEIVSAAPDTQLVGIDKTLVEVSRLTQQIAPLKAKAEGIEGNTADDYRELGGILSEERALKKQGVGLFAPAESIIDRAKNWLKIQVQRHTIVCEELDRLCLGKMKAYEHAEAQAAQAEQDRINAERRKKAEEEAEAARKRRAKEIAEAQRAGEIGKREAEKQKAEAAAAAARAVENVGEVKVKPNISSTPGYRRSTVYRIEVTESAVVEFLKAVKAGRKDLMKYVILDEQALGAEARDMKDPEKFMATYPGVKCHKE